MVIGGLKNVIITGCSTGIGKDAANYLREKGMRVFPTARAKKDVNMLCEEGFEAYLIDLNDEKTIQSSVLKILRNIGEEPVGLVNNAGLAFRGAIEDCTTEDFRLQFETNLFGLHTMTLLLLPHMKRCGYGRIINVSSITGFLSFPFLGCYSASKFALEAYSDALYSEILQYGLYVSIIQPGPIRTNFQINTEKSIERFSLRQKVVHRKVYNRITKRIKSGKYFSRGGAFSLPPFVVSKKIFHALTAIKPKRRYKVSIISHLLYLFCLFAPTVLKDRFCRFLIQGLKKSAC